MRCCYLDVGCEIQFSKGWHCNNGWSISKHYNFLTPCSTPMSNYYQIWLLIYITLEQPEQLNLRIDRSVACNINSSIRKILDVLTYTLNFDYILSCRAVAMQQPRDRPLPEPFPGNGTVNTFPQQWYSYRGTVFSVWSVPRGYKRIKVQRSVCRLGRILPPWPCES
jgi:hypothetical protein